MSDPKPWLDEALSIRRDIADLHDRLTALGQQVPKRASNDFQVQTLQAAQRDLAGAQHWIAASEAAMRSKHRLPTEPAADDLGRCPATFDNGRLLCGLTAGHSDPEHLAHDLSQHWSD